MGAEPTGSSQETVPESGRGTSWSWYLLALAAACLAYVLSVGPVARHYRGKRPPTPIDTFYAPLEYIAENFEPARRFFSWYVADLWMRGILPHAAATPSLTQVPPTNTTPATVGQ